MSKQKNQGGLVVETGPNGWMIAGVGGLIGVAGVILAVAVWQIAASLGLACIILSAGVSGGFLLRGASEIIRAAGDAKAKMIEAKGDAQAQILAARHRPHVFLEPAGRPVDGEVRELRP